MASSGVSGLLALTSLYNDAGSCDRLDDFLSVAAERARKATGSRECFVLYLGDQAQHLALSVSPGSPGVLSPLLQSVWSRKAPPAARLGQGPFQLEEILQEVRSDLEEEARSRSQSPPALVSIYHGEVPVGLAGLWEPEGYDSGIGETLSQALSVALTNYRLFAESRHHLARQSFLREVGGIFSTLGQLDEKVADFLARIELLRGVDAATLALVDPETGRLVPAGGSRIRADLHPFVEGLAREAAARSVLLHVEDLRQRGGPAGFLSYLGVPLKRRESVIGVLSILSRREKGFSRTDQEFFASLSEQVALNVENARLMEQTRQQLEELSFVFRVSTRLRQEKTLPGVMDVILEQCVRSINAQAGFLFFYEAEPGRLVPAAVFGSRAVELSALPLRGPGFDHAESLLKLRYCGRPRTDYPELFADPALSGLAADLPGWILIPLRTDRGLLGAVLIGHGPPAELSASQRRLLLTLTNVAENAIGRSMAFLEMQARAREEAASRAKSEFLAIMSHELRTPLTAILGFTEVLLGEHFGPLAEKQREYLQDILHNGEHLLSLINDVLDLAKVEAGKMELSLETLNLEEVLDETLASFTSLAEKKEITLIFPVVDTPLSLRGDRRRLKQILFNLMSNAIKFTDRRGTVELRLGGGDGHVLLQVADTGIGISREDQERIFHPFAQAGQPAGRTYEGTGLGLSLTRRLVELHGGRIWVDSAPGQGSTFSVLLPVGGPP